MPCEIRQTLAQHCTVVLPLLPGDTRETEADVDNLQTACVCVCVEVIDRQRRTK